MGDYDPAQHFRDLIPQVQEHFNKGRLTRLNQWFRDLTEMQIETRDLKFNRYLIEKTGYHIDIFQAFNLRIQKIIDKGKITTINQFYDINILVNELSQIEPVDAERIEKLNELLAAYELRK
jgi:hypothetical protein